MTTATIASTIERVERRGRYVARTMPGALAEVAAKVRLDLSRVTWPSARWREDPVGFCRDVLGIEPWDKQIEILEAIRDHKRVAVRSGHKCGKSTTAAIAALWFYCSHADARVVMTCVTSRQVDAILYREVRKMHARAGHCVACAKVSKERTERTPPLPPLPRPCEHSALIGGEPGELARTGLKSDDFRELVGFTAREAEAVAGTSGPNILYLPDEASGIPRAIFEAIEGNRAGGNARIAMFSNPTQTEGVFFEAFEDPKVSKLYKLVHVSSEDTPNVKGTRVIPGLADPEWVAEKREEWGEDSPLYKVRVKGEFVRNEEGKIMSLHLLGEAEARWAETPATGRLQLGVDPAGPGEGGDETAFSARRGLKQIAKQEHRGQTGEAIVVHLLGFINVHRVPREVPIICLDREGPIGSEVFGLLRAYLDDHRDAFELYGVRSSDKAPRQPTIYGTVRDELHANAAEWMRGGGAILEDAKLAKDLHAASWVAVAAYGVNASRLKATDKKTLRKELGRSPDRGDAFMLSVWEPMALTTQTDDGAVPTRAADPYEDSDDVSRALSPYGGSF